MKKWKTKNGYNIIRILSGRSNVFLLTNNQIIVLIDTCSAAYRNKLDKRLRSSGINRIDYLILSHSHYDHADNASMIRSDYKAKVIIHREESGNLTSGKGVIPRGTNPYTRFLTDNFGRLFASRRFETCSYDILIDDYYSMKDWGFNACIIHTPGHTPGSISVIVDDEVAIVGDAMFGIFRNSVFPPFGWDEKQLVQSWGRLLKTGCKVFLPSHGSENSRELVKKDYEARIRD